MALDLVELARVLLAFGGTAVAAYFDVTNNRNVPNKVSYGFVALALLVNFAQFDLNAFLFTAGVALAIFLVGYLFYRMGHIGGADVLVLCAIALALPKQPSAALLVPQREFAIQFPFVLSVIIAASLFFSLAMLIRHVPAAGRAVAAGKVRIPPERWLYALLVGGAYIVFMYMAVQLPFFPPVYLALITFVMLSSLFFMLFKEHIQESMLELIPLSRIQEEDVLAVERMDKKLVEKYGLQRLLTLGEIARLKKLPIKKFPVYTRMPMFLPYILIGLVVSLLFGDLLFLAAGL